MPASTREKSAHMRNIPTCSSCHDLNNIKLGTPWLDGQSAVYINAELQAFASSTRRNDTSQQMRNIARQMTSDEMNEAARYYAAQP
jgi:cytochrome c553